MMYDVIAFWAWWEYTSSFSFRKDREIQFIEWWNRRAVYGRIVDDEVTMISVRGCVIVH
jgi:hypothetical protein